MPPKKRKLIGQKNPKSIKAKRLRKNETVEQSDARHDKERERARTIRAIETSEERRTRLETMREKANTSRATETSEERQKRLEKKREGETTSRATETSEERQKRLEKKREGETTSRATETLEERQKRLEKMREIATTSRDTETLEERQKRLEKKRESANTARVSRSSHLNLAGFQYDPQHDYAQHPYVDIGGMIYICKYCQAKKFKTEPPGMCCRSGKVKLTPLNTPPNDLQLLMSGTTSESKHFLRNLRRYNSCFQMTSFGATSIVDLNGFATTFKVQGQIYHRIGSLLPLPDQNPQFLQVYFMGNEQIEVDHRCDCIPGVRRNIVLSLQRMLHENNHLINTFKTSLENMPNDEYKVVIRADKREPGEHERRFNAPQVNEVAIIMSDHDFNQRDIIIQRRSNSLQRISETHRSYDALQYPLIFCEGEDGYHFNLKQVDPVTGAPTVKKVSALDFYAYRLMIRNGSTNHILQCRQLYHQYVVDMYAKIESERLLYIRLNQKKLRVEDYIHLKDALVNDGDIQNIGKVVILPATFTGSPRQMQEYAQDALSYVRSYGRPDLFITFTCNPDWGEIKESLSFGQTSSDRQDIIARVFRQKQIKLIDILTKYNIFGETRCWMYSIEWQKRGLPHSHNLIWLKEKLHPVNIDQIISAEFPDPETDPNLFAVVKKNMIHGPCGHLNTNAPCMKDGKCSKKYPRKLIKDTQTGEDGYPVYRRRAPQDGGFTATIKIKGNTEVEVDNKWVVPYSPILSKMFLAHINVEYCSSVKSIKYICKYVNKGSDMAVFGVTDDNALDEVSRYMIGRYISSNEAVWRIMSFPIHERHPTVVHLNVHLENGQRVYFTRENAQALAERPPNTTLTAFFQLCQSDAFARILLYPEVPRFYTWNKSKKVFCKRKQGVPVAGEDAVASEALGRVYTVNPNNAECYFLRHLLHAVRGPTSFEYLKTVNGEVCQTFREACQRRGLLEDDRHWDHTLSKAVLRSSPEQIRNLFCIILTICNPSNPNGLWEKYRESMSEDLPRDNSIRASSTLRSNCSSDIFNLALILLEDKCLSINNKTLPDLGLQPPKRNERDILDKDLIREKNYNIEELHKYVESNKVLLNSDQTEAYEVIMYHVNEEKGGIFFLDAPGGTGKTFLINIILAEIRMKRDLAIAIASSGIASTLLDGGRTAHSALRLPLNIANEQHPTCNISKASGQAKVLKTCKIIVWDECTMAHKKSLEALDLTLQDLRDNSQLMGGALVVLAGDFRQTLPVIPRSTPADEINACLKSSFLWRNVKTIKLRTNMRVQQQKEAGALIFAENLLHIGEGTYPTQMKSGDITFLDDFCKRVTSLQDLIHQVYPNLSENYLNKEWLCDRAILASKNTSVSELNGLIQDMIPGTCTEYASFDSVTDVNETVNYPTEFLNSLDTPWMPPHKLQLKIGSPIILLRNINPPILCNGTRLCIKSLFPNVIEATVLTGKGKGEDVFIPRIPIIPTDMPFSFKRLQFPVRLAFSITINKSQGQSIKCTGINLEYPCFSHGQLYVACSRVGSPNQLFIFAPMSKTRNVVYKDVLQ